MLLLKYGWHGLPALLAVYKDDSEERLCRQYTADVLGAIARSNGATELPLFSEIISKKHEKQESAQQILDRVEKMFSQGGDMNGLVQPVRETDT